MTENKRLFTRKRAMTVVLVCAAVLILLIALRWINAGRVDMSTLEGRVEFLSSLGWEIDPDSEQCQGVIIPDVLDGVMADYNAMQLEQGYDLNSHLGERCDQYTYVLTNYPDSSCTVYITIYVQGRSIIAGDIHTASINGFMHGITRSAG